MHAFKYFFILSVVFFTSKSLAVAASKTPLLILISFDGFRNDYLDNNTLPYISRHFIENGVRVKSGLVNVFPTVTYPNHWSLATGLYPESSGVVANVMFDPDLNQTFVDFQAHDNDTIWYDKYNQSMPIWILNELSGGKSGLIGSYPGGNVKIAGRSVSFSLDYKNEMSWFERVDNMIKWFTNPSETERINMGVLYFPEPDESGHEFGPHSEEIKQVLLKCDLVIGYLMSQIKVAGLDRDMNIIITSDHGMYDVAEKRSIDLSDYVDTSKFKSFGGLTQINIFPNKRNQIISTASNYLYYLKTEFIYYSLIFKYQVEDTESIYEALKTVPNYEIYRKNEVPDRFHYRLNSRIGPLVMFPDVGYEIFRSNREKFDWSHWSKPIIFEINLKSFHSIYAYLSSLKSRGRSWF